MIALTGPTGFLGKAIMQKACLHSVPLVPLVRATDATTAGQAESCAPRVIGVLGGGPIDPGVFAGCTAVIHAAARAHHMGERGPESLAAYRRTNVAGTQSLIVAMHSAEVRRLVYVSSIKAVAERSAGVALRPAAERRPEDPYGQSKAEAEDAIRAACADGGIEAVIIRPPLVYGLRVKGNLVRLMEGVWAGKLLPLGAVKNRRSFVGVGNLAEAVLMAAMPMGGNSSVPGRPRHSDERELVGPRGDQGIPTSWSLSVPAGNDELQLVDANAGRRAGARWSQPGVYHIADDGVISTRKLVEVLAEGLGVKPRLISVPRWLAVGGATLLGKGAVARRLFDDLEVDDSDFRRDFHWKPRLGLEEGLRLMAEDFARRMRDGSVPAVGG